MPALTRSDLVSRIGDLIGDPNDTRWSSTQKQNKLQEAQENFVLDTRALLDSQSFSVVSGTSTYALATDTLDLTRVALNGLPLRRFSKFDLDLLTGADWTQQRGTPASYFVDITSTNRNLTVYPNPTDGDAGTNNLVCEYIKVPPTLSSDSSTPLNSQTLLQPYLMALAYFGARDFLIASDNPQDSTKAKLYDGLYRQYVSECIETFKALQETTPMRMRGGRFFKGL